MRKTLLTATLAAGCMTMTFGVTGCGPKGVSDQALTTDIQAKLFADPTAKTANVKVSVANGVVTLTGDAPTSDVALQVVNIANGTTGVKSVDNELKIDSADASAAPPAPVTPATTTPAPVAASAPPPAPVAVPSERRHDDAMRHEEPPQPRDITIPAGTTINVQTIDGISSKTNTAGQTFRASLSAPVIVDGTTVFPSGSDATILLDNAKGAGRIAGSSDLEVRLTKISHAGQTYDVVTNVHDEVGKGRGKQTAVRSGIGAAAGAVIGAIAGGGKGAAIGSLAGGGAGAGFQLATHGQQVTIPSESQLTFSLQAPVVVQTHRDHDHSDAQ